MYLSKYQIVFVQKIVQIVFPGTESWRLPPTLFPPNKLGAATESNWGRFWSSGNQTQTCVSHSNYKSGRRDGWLIMIIRHPGCCEFDKCHNKQNRTRTRKEHKTDNPLLSMIWAAPRCKVWITSDLNIVPLEIWIRLLTASSFYQISPLARLLLCLHCLAATDMCIFRANLLSVCFQFVSSP